MNCLAKTMLVTAAFLGSGLIDAQSQAAQTAEQKFIIIGTGGVTGVYYPAGGAICRVLNKGRKTHGIRCSVESTGASVYNINAIRQGDLDFGVAQSDTQYNAYNGRGKFKGKAYKDLRSVFSLHPEAFTIVARDDSGIAEFKDLKGKRFNIGDPGSGTRANAEAIMRNLGWTLDDFKLATELKIDEAPQAMCNNTIDAFAFTVGHPSSSTKEATTTCASHLVNVTDEGARKLVEGAPYYSWATIPGDRLYGDPKPTATFGVRATLVTSAQTPDDVVYELVKAVFENLDSFKKLHPAFATLNKRDMVHSTLTAPLHPGAEKYYREVGLLK